MKEEQSSNGYPSVLATLWQDAWAAISSPSRYLVWALQPFSRSVRYLLALCVFVSIVISLYALVALRQPATLFGDWAEQQLPTIVFDGAHLSTVNDETFFLGDSDSFFFKIDPTISKEDEPHIDNFYRFGYLLTSDQLISQTELEETVVSYEELALPAFQLSGQQINQWIEKRYALFVLSVLPVLAFLYLFISKFLFSAFFAFLLLLGSRFRANFEHCWNMAIYALTPAMAVSYLVFIFLPGARLYLLVYLGYLLFAFYRYDRFLLHGMKK